MRRFGHNFITVTYWFTPKQRAYFSKPHIETSISFCEYFLLDMQRCKSLYANERLIISQRCHQTIHIRPCTKQPNLRRRRNAVRSTRNAFVWAISCIADMWRWSVVLWLSCVSRAWCMDAMHFHFSQVIGTNKSQSASRRIPLPRSWIRKYSSLGNNPYGATSKVWIRLKPMNIFLNFVFTYSRL